jgi:hypothetical protein
MRIFEDIENEDQIGQKGWLVLKFIDVTEMHIKNNVFK